MTVHYGRRSRRSGRILGRALRGHSVEVNFGYGVSSSAFNSPRAIQRASNKRRALEILRENGVPVPRVYGYEELIVSPPRNRFPVIGRTDRHRAGQGLFLCQDRLDVVHAQRRGATHYLSYIERAREFRVHIAFGKSIKIAEKIGGRGVARNFVNGAFFAYPDFNHKKTLRRVAKDAVQALGLDFGAVDVLYKDGKYYVLEVNTAPSLTSRSDILGRYVKAFTEVG